MVHGYSGPYGNMYGYILGAGAPVGMPSGSNNQNAYILGTAGQYLTGTLKRARVAVYSNLGSLPGSPFPIRLNVPGVVLAPAMIGPQRAFFPNRNGKTSSTTTLPY